MPLRRFPSAIRGKLSASGREREAGRAAVEQFEIDPAHTVVGSSVRHLVISKVRGVFIRVKGAILIDDDDMTRSSVDVTIDTASIDTNELVGDLVDMSIELEAVKVPVPAPI